MTWMELIKFIKSFWLIVLQSSLEGYGNMIAAFQARQTPLLTFAWSLRAEKHLSLLLSLHVYKLRRHADSSGNCRACGRLWLPIILRTVNVTYPSSAEEIWGHYPDAIPARSFYPGDDRAALTPFLAFKELGDNFKWILYGDDDTVFFPDAALELASTMDPELPYFVTDNLWWSPLFGGAWHPNPQVNFSTRTVDAAKWSRDNESKRLCAGGFMQSGYLRIDNLVSAYKRGSCHTWGDFVCKKTILMKSELIIAIISSCVSVRTWYLRERRHSFLIMQACDPDADPQCSFLPFCHVIAADLLAVLAYTNLFAMIFGL